MTPKLSILTPAIWRRIDKTRALADLIAPHPQVEHVVVLDNMTRSVGLKRQACLDSAIGEYVMFCDDDDEIFPETIPLILAATKNAPDVITFKQVASYNGKLSEVVFHINNTDGPFIEGGQTLRAPWHVCAWKRELVADCLFPDINYGEDRVWAEQARRRVTSDCHIDQVLHRYTHDARETAAPEYCNPSANVPTLPHRPPLGTRVKHTTHGEGKIFSYEQCDDASCGVDFGRKGQWCIAIRELIIPPSTQALVRSAAPTARDLAEKFDMTPLSEENHSKNLVCATMRQRRL